MSAYTDYIPLVRQAQQGDAAARRDLARLAEVRLAEYVGRITLNRDLTADIVQESIAEMLKILHTLRDPQHFWGWLYAITLNKVRAHYRRHWRRTEALADMQRAETQNLASLHGDQQNVLAELVAEELKQIVVRAVAELEPRQRAVLMMRCYEQMSYARISEAMHCSQLGARALFYRAKKTLARLLNSHGIDKSALPVALLFFGKLTARSEAAAAGVSITAATLHIGPWTSLVALAAQPVLAAILLVGALAGTGGAFLARHGGPSPNPAPAAAGAQAAPAWAVSQDMSYWYYYPPRTSQMVMIRTRGQAPAYSQWLQSEQANYYRQGNRVHIRNHRQFAPDLSIWRLPTDPPALTSFLQRCDPRGTALEYVARSSRGLLVAVERDDAGRPQQTTLAYDVSMEDYFRHDWSSEVVLVDERDEAHRRGWTYFTIAGRLGEQRVSGFGRLPFVAAAARQHGPWLRLTTGDVTILDTGTAAGAIDESGTVLAGYRGGSFFQGLGRPWSGLHTIDTIRRDAALAGITFTTTALPDGQHVEITLDSPQARLTYRVHLYEDWIESITFSKEGESLGDWTFSYPQADEADPHRLTVPSLPPGARGQDSSPNGLWLMRLAQGFSVR
jgi:RNA polymerase sigma-70 factor (ECF subfamily)